MILSTVKKNLKLELLSSKKHLLRRSWVKRHNIQPMLQSWSYFFRLWLLVFEFFRAEALAPAPGF